MKRTILREVYYPYKDFDKVGETTKQIIVRLEHQSGFLADENNHVVVEKLGNISDFGVPKTPYRFEWECLRWLSYSICRTWCTENISNFSFINHALIDGFSEKHHNFVCYLNRFVPETGEYKIRLEYSTQPNEREKVADAISQFTGLSIAANEIDTIFWILTDLSAELHKTGPSSTDQVIYKTNDSSSLFLLLCLAEFERFVIFELD